MNYVTRRQPASIPCDCITCAEQELLTSWGFSAEEITTLLRLQKWYQTGGSDRALIVRHLEFLCLLVRSGELEL